MIRLFNDSEINFTVNKGFFSTWSLTCLGSECRRVKMNGVMSVLLGELETSSSLNAKCLGTLASKNRLERPSLSLLLFSKSIYGTQVSSEKQDQLEYHRE